MAIKANRKMAPSQALGSRACCGSTGKKDRLKAVSIAFAQKILGSSDNFVGVGKQEPKPEPGHGNEDA